jgi:hypothetical protein
MAMFAQDCPGYFDNIVLLGSTAVECGRSVETARRSQLAPACAHHGAQRVVLVLAGVAAKVAQEVHGAALPRRAEHLRQRSLPAGVRVADGQLPPEQPARNEAAQNSVQNASVSASPMSRPMISRRPVSCTACAITTALRCTRPESRTFSICASTNR